MSCYGFDHVIRECLEEKAAVINTARGKSVGAKIDIYANSWVALNAWIESRLLQQKGASISGFGSFCWEMLEKDGETHCRPLFLLDDTFVKVHRVRRKRIHYPPQLTPVEEVNFSLLAIKFSKTLTKDMIFNGIRDITRKIGDFVSRGYQVEIEFTFGTLSAKENRVKFSFNQQRLIDILPENVEPGVYRHNDKPLKYIETDVLTERSEVNQTRQISTATLTTRNSTANETKKAPTIPTLDFTKKGNSFSSVPIPKQPPTKQPPLNNSLSMSFSSTSFKDFNDTYDETKASSPFYKAGSMAMSTTNLESPTSYNRGNSAGEPATASSPLHASFSATSTMKPNEPIPPNPELRAILDAIGNRELTVGKEEFRQKAKERVIAQAFNRALTEMESNAKDEDFRRYEERKLYEAWRANENQKKEKIHEKSKQLKDSLDSQLEFSKTRHLEEINDRKNSMAKFILPDTAGVVPLSMVIDSNTGKPMDRRKLISTELRQQIEKNLIENKQKKNESVQKERDLINKIQLENELQTIIQRADHLNKQKSLLEAWEQDGHLRNLKKLQNYGKELVTDYIDRNLVDINSTMNTFTPSLNQSLNMSIGYDSRMGKFDK